MELSEKKKIVAAEVMKMKNHGKVITIIEYGQCRNIRWKEVWEYNKHLKMFLFNNRRVTETNVNRYLLESLCDDPNVFNED